MVGLWWICRWLVVYMWLACGVYVVGLWWICGKFVVDMWREYGGHVAGMLWTCDPCGYIQIMMKIIIILGVPLSV